MSNVPTKAERTQAADILRKAMSHRTARHQRMMIQAQMDNDLKLADSRRIAMELEVAMTERIIQIFERDSLADDTMVG